MFWNKKTGKQKDFYNAYKKLPANYQVTMIIWINLYSYLKWTIDENIFSKLNKLFRVTDEIKRIVYYVVTQILDASELVKNKIIIGRTDSFFKMTIGGCFLGSVTNDITTIEKFDHFKVDENIEIAFGQMMSKILSLNGKEYTDANDYNDIFDEFVRIGKAFVGGSFIGFKRTDPNELNKKMHEIIDNANDGELLFFSMACAMPLMKFD